MIIPEYVQKEIEKKADKAWEEHKPDACRDEFVCDFKNGYFFGAQFGYELGVKNRPPATGRTFFVKANGYQDEACTTPNEGIDLTKPGEDRWIYTTIQTVHPGKNSVAMKNKWLHLREVTPEDEDREKAVRGVVEACEPFAKALSWISMESLEANSLRSWSPAFCGKDFVAIRKALAAWEPFK